MNNQLAEILKAKIPTASYTDKVGGLVTIVEKVMEADGGIKAIKKQPVCYTPAAVPILMIPNSNNKSLIYFEDYGIVNIGSNGRGIQYNSKLRLVCWLNASKIITGGSMDKFLGSKICQHIISSLVSNPFNQSPFTGITVTVSGMPVNDKNIFSKYDYDEADKQYLLPPYDFFAIDLNIHFSISNTCLNAI